MRYACWLLCNLFLLSNAAVAQIDWPRIELVPLVRGINLPTHVTNAGDGSGRSFIVEQRGMIRIFRDGGLLDTPFLDIRDRVRFDGAGAERGLLSVAFPPGFGQNQNQHFYVYYTRQPFGDITIARYQVTDNPDVADHASENILLSIEHRTFSNHNGGQLAFGPDGYLYLGTGDGGGGGDPFRYGQNTRVLLAKLLRIDVESGVDPYRIPPDNPFVGMEGYREEIWAYGLRNPWRFSFDPANGDLYIADVGQNLWEEVDYQAAGDPGGENYGWNIMEGFHCYPPGSECDPTGLTLPVIEYGHTRGDCSITGGFVYRGDAYPGMQGIYFYGDYCTGRIWGLKFDGTDWQTQLLVDAGRGLSISTFGTDEDGNLLVAQYGDSGRGAIYLVTEVR